MMSQDQNSVAVQGTNDISIVSKCSMMKFGYYEDPFLQCFVEKSCRHSPLIHRGYYVRAKVLDHCFVKFLEEYGSSSFQIISFGAGFDSSYFRLKSQGRLSYGTYIEVDFPDVMRRKKNLIRNRQNLANLLSNEIDSLHKSIVLKSVDYLMVGVDLTDLEMLTKILQLAGVDTNVPTLLLSEVAITYMPALCSTKVIEWSGRTYTNAAFILYEQIRPSDSFGHVMQNAFNKCSCPLLALNEYPSLESQCLRFKNAGWKSTKACDMNQFFLNEVPSDERRRIENLEPFDEYEEWHLKCAHYMMLCAFNGNCEELIPKMLPSVPLNDVETLNSAMPDSCASNTPSVCPELSWQLEETAQCSMYGHSITDLGDELICIGGFGLRYNQSHGRLQAITVFQKDFSSSYVQPVYTSDNVPVILERMYHTATRLSDASILVIGGRTSPTKPCNILTLIEVNRPVEGHQDHQMADGDGSVNGEMTLKFIVRDVGKFNNQEEPALRWRHSATIVEINGRMKCFVYGGKSQTEIFGDFWILDTEELKWSKINSNGICPGFRHSHTCDWNDGKFYISCGLGYDAAFGDVTLFDLATESWTKLAIQGQLTPRYSHTSSICDNWMLLLGGVALDGTNPGLCRINLNTGTCLSYSLPAQNPAAPIMLHGHCSMPLTPNKVVVLGGGILPTQALLKWTGFSAISNFFCDWLLI